MKSAAPLLLLLSSANAFSTSPFNVRAPQSSSSLPMSSYLDSIQTKSIEMGELDGAPVNGAAAHGDNKDGVPAPTVVPVPEEKTAATADELKVMQEALAQAEARLAALKLEIPAEKVVPAPKKKSINMKLPSLNLPKISVRQVKKSVSAEEVVAAEEVAAAPIPEEKPEAVVVAVAKPVEGVVKPVAAITPTPVKKVIKNPKSNGKAPQSNGDYLASLSSNSMKMKQSPIGTSYLDSISKKPVLSRVNNMVNLKSVANLDPMTLLAYQFLRNVAGVVSISASWFITSKKFGLSPLAPGLWQPSTAMSVGFFLLINILRPLRVGLSTKISSLWEGMTRALQRRLNLSKPTAMRVAAVVNVMASAALLTGGILLASKYANVPLDKMTLTPVKKGAKRAVKTAAKLATKR